MVMMMPYYYDDDDDDGDDKLSRQRSTPSSVCLEFTLFVSPSIFQSDSRNVKRGNGNSDNKPETVTKWEVNHSSFSLCLWPRSCA